VPAQTVAAVERHRHQEASLPWQETQGLNGAYSSLDGHRSHSEAWGSACVSHCPRSAVESARDVTSERVSVQGSQRDIGHLAAPIDDARAPRRRRVTTCESELKRRLAVSRFIGALSRVFVSSPPTLNRSGIPTIQSRAPAICHLDHTVMNQTIAYDR